MLQLKNIRKKYNTGGYEQIALDDVSLNLRDESMGFRMVRNAGKAE